MTDPFVLELTAGELVAVHTGLEHITEVLRANAGADEAEHLRDAQYALAKAHRLLYGDDD